MAEKPLGFVFNQQVLTFLLGVITLCYSIFAGVSWINDRSHYETNTSAAITELRSQDAAQLEANKQLSSEIKNLGESVTDLALTLKEVEVIQRTQPLTGFNATTVPSLANNR